MVKFITYTIGGVDKRNIFDDDNGRFRFIFSLFECNDCRPVVMRDRIYRRKERNKKTRPTLAEVSMHPTSRHFERKSIVDILCFCLMPNHYHLVVRQLVDAGVSNFMRKLGDSYVKYFNDKHSRKGMGSLFQGKFKARLIENNDQFINTIIYVHANPIGILEKKWKEEGINNIKAALDFLDEYRWSSYLDYSGKNNFPSVIEKKLVLQTFAGENDNYEKLGIKNMENYINGWIKYKGELMRGLSKLEYQTK